MRWAGQAVAVNGTPVDDGALPGLQRIGLVRSVRVPQFEGMTFHEVLCKSALNKVPNAAALPFRYTVNGYRGCSHGCRYCFARPTHEYLDFDSGADFDTQVVVKTNVVEVLRRELRRPSWRRETVALGTNTDPYQRAEGRYALMPGIIGALAGVRHTDVDPDQGNPASQGSAADRRSGPTGSAVSGGVAGGRRPGAAPGRRAGHAVASGSPGDSSPQSATPVWPAT